MSLMIARTWLSRISLAHGNLAPHEDGIYAVYSVLRGPTGAAASTAGPQAESDTRLPRCGAESPRALPAIAASGGPSCSPAARRPTCHHDRASPGSLAHS